MAKLAIKGHATRGSEVIEILEMLGGKNKISSDGERCFLGSDDKYYYTIEEDNNIAICYRHNYEKTIKYRRFSLEEFLDKYPYKIGDKVCFSDSPNHSLTIKKIWWNSDCSDLECTFYEDDIDVSVKDLQPYKEETMEKEISGAIIDRFICLEGFEFYDDKGNIINTKEITMKKKQPQYSETYEECCELLGKTKAYQSVSGYKTELLEDFQKLLICRDAYWKIKGNWAPDWINSYQKKWTISFYQGEIHLATSPNVHRLLAFPTEEMRDAFYDNFKELIEECKELL